MKIFSSPDFRGGRAWSAIRQFLPLAFVAAALALAGTLLAATRQAEGATVGGIVQDDRGSPVGNARVTISAPGLTSSALTAPDGKYEFRKLQPGQYRITASAERFRKEGITVTVTKPDEVVTAPPIRLSFSSLHVAVFDANNQPLRGVTVTLNLRGGSPPGSAARAITDEGGDAYFGRLAPGSYQLTAFLRGYDEYSNEVFISADITTEFPLQLLVAPVIPINEKAIARYGVPNLPSKNVQAIFQDSEGWLWFGTDKGVARFNGADFKSSATPGSPYERLAGEDVRSIAEDHSGDIWLATLRGARRITKVGGEAGDGLNGHDTRQIEVDASGNVWFATASGLFRFDGKDFIQVDVSKGLPSNDVRALAEDAQGRLWIATAQGVAIREGDRITPFAPPAAPAAAGERDQPQPEPAPIDARSVFVDKDGGVWFAAATGVMLFDGSSLRSVEIDALANSGAGATGVRAIGQDARKRMWFAPAAGGAVIYDPAQNESQRVASFAADRVAAFYTGREGGLWLGSDNGCAQADLYSFVSFTTSRGLADNDVRAVVEGPAPGDSGARGLWFVTASGISRMEGERFAPVERALPRVGVRAVAFDSAGAVWFATDQGVARLSGRTLTQYSEGKGLASNHVQWVTSIAGGSAVVFATARGAHVFENEQIRNLEKLSGMDVRHVFEDKDGRLWFATARGVVNLDRKSGEADFLDTSRGLADDDARWITRFADRLIIATRQGVQAYDGRRPGAAAFSTLDGDPARALFVDSDDYLWVGNDDGRVKKFKLFEGHIISTAYSGETYALTGSRIHAISEDSGKNIWIATDKGAVRHIPVRVAPLARISLSLDGKEVAATGSGAYNLPYGQQRVTFRFTAASMSGQVRFLSHLNSEQGEQPWRLLPMQQGAEREETVYGLDEGAHSFELLALNRDLYGIEKPAAVLAVRVGRPFWKRWWFYTLSLAVLLLSLASIVVAHRMRAREFVLPKELRSYVPIEPNPYIVGNPIRTEKMFYGREDDFRYVRTKLEGVNQGVVIVFCGERRAGKSSILYQVLNGRLGDRFIPVFVDMQEMVIANDAEFFARISRLICEAIARADRQARMDDSLGRGLSAPGAVISAASQVGGAPVVTAQTVAPPVSPPHFDGSNPYPVFLDFLDETLAAIGDRTLLILMDEYELMESKVDEGKLSPELFTFLAGLMDNKERLALIFTGSRRLEERDRKYWRELLRRSLFRKISYLSGNDTVRLITEPVAGKVVYGRGVVEMICRLTAGQPFYTQVICQNAVDYMNEHRQNWITVADMRQVLAEIVDNPLPQMIYTWDALSDDEKLALSLLADRLTDGYAYATAADLRSSVRLNQYPVNLSSNTIRLTLEELFRRELLEKDAGEGFRFRMDLFRIWIRRSHSIWQVVKEVRTL
ncbi:MAG TPA: two-component regulator propeller domain-containing protein [Blastocatellia bacterium]|nr:two-component regulator propeller domain-containing protein [Blastocatellia bacterium]